MFMRMLCRNPCACHAKSILNPLWTSKSGPRPWCFKRPQTERPKCFAPRAISSRIGQNACQQLLASGPVGINNPDLGEACSITVGANRGGGPREDLVPDLVPEIGYQAWYQMRYHLWGLDRSLPCGQFFMSEKLVLAATFSIDGK